MKWGNNYMDSETKISGIYKITNIQNGKSYIGESADIYRRWEEHRVVLEENKHYNYKLQADYNYYGKDSFTAEILLEHYDVSKSAYTLTMERIYLESVAIKKYDAINSGYNIEDTCANIINGQQFRMNPHLDKKMLIRLVKSGDKLYSPKEILKRQKARERKIEKEIQLEKDREEKNKKEAEKLRLKEERKKQKAEERRLAKLQQNKTKS